MCNVSFQVVFFNTCRGPHMFFYYGFIRKTLELREDVLSFYLITSGLGTMSLQQFAGFVTANWTQQS